MVDVCSSNIRTYEAWLCTMCGKSIEREGCIEPSTKVARVVSKAGRHASDKGYTEIMRRSVPVSFLTCNLWHNCSGGGPFLQPENSKECCTVPCNARCQVQLQYMTRS